MHDPSSFRCQFRGCGHRFRAEDAHRYHLRCHLAHPSEDERFRCPVPNCEQGSKLWPTLANHLWNTHHLDIELQSCNRCDFKLVRKAEFLDKYDRRGQSDRHSSPNLKVQLFHSRTYSLSNLEKVHKLVHSEEKQFDCNQCQSKFRTIKQLRNHQ